MNSSRRYLILPAILIVAVVAIISIRSKKPSSADPTPSSDEQASKSELVEESSTKGSQTRTPEPKDKDPYTQKIGTEYYPRSYQLQAKVKYQDTLKNLGAALKRGEEIKTFEYVGPDGKPTTVEIESHQFFEDDPDGVEIVGKYADMPESELIATYLAGYEAASGRIDLETYFAYEPQTGDEHLYIFTYDVNEMLRDWREAKEFDRREAAKEQVFGPRD